MIQTKIVEIDLNNLSALQEEYKIIEKRKSVAEAEYERVTKETTALSQKTDKEIAKLKSDVETELQTRKVELNKYEKKLEKREKDIEKREEEYKTLEEDFAKLAEAQKAFANEQVNVEKIKATCSEKEHQAELTIAQYNDKLAELAKVK